MMHPAELLTLAGTQVPPRLRELLLLLASGGASPVEPDEVEGVHPLVIPLALEPGGALLGLLRWPTGSVLPLVRQHALGPRRGSLDLVALDVDAAVHRILVLRESQGEELGGALLAAVNRPGVLYQPGDRARSGLPLNAYLLLRVGESHSFFDELVDLHLERGDKTAALVTADRACRVAEGWGRPQASRALLLEKLGQTEEARDAAAAALAEPLWTLGHPFDAIAPLAGWTSASGEPFRRLGLDPTRPPADRAAHLMDAHAVDLRPWDELRPTLVDLYREAGLPEVASLVAPR
jgi:hypothetical protein